MVRSKHKKVMAMKITFKLSAAQERIASVIAAEVAAENNSMEKSGLIVYKHGSRLSRHETREVVFYRGNLMPADNHSFNFNTSQNLDLNLESHIVTYTGERFPLLCDGAIGVIKRIFSAESVSEIPAPAAYESSRTEMLWYETLWDFYNRTLPKKSAAEVLEEVLNNFETFKYSVHSPLWDENVYHPEDFPRIVIKAVKAYLPDTDLRELQQLLTSSVDKMSAQFGLRSPEYALRMKFEDVVREHSFIVS